MLTQAQGIATRIVADPIAARNQQATILNAGNGVVQVNIQTPSSAGVSRNTYSQFDVGNQGAILNNSRAKVQTQLGGWVQGNDWLSKGSARVILNEVNSSKPSYLHGYVEVAGQKAEVIIANPAGIAVNGGGFINASGVTLTTGTPVLNNGGLESYRVQRGVVSVDGRGLDTRTTEYTAILSRAAQINAGIWANRLQLVTGPSQIDVSALGTDATIQTQALPGIGATPTYALDVGQLGGMYAGKITLIGTEAGLGVRNAGLVQANSGALALTQEGWLSNSGTLLATGGDVSIHTRSNLEQSGTVYSDRNLLLTSQTDQTHSGNSSALGDVNIQATGTNADGTATKIQASRTTVWAAGLKTDGQLSGQQTLNVQASGQIQTAGQALATRALVMQGAGLDLSQSQQQAQTLQLQASTGEFKATNSQLLANDLLQLQTPQALITDGAKVQAGTLSITANSLSNVAGQIVQTGTTDQSIILQGSLNNTAGVIQTSANNLTITAQSIDNTAGQLLHAGGGTFSVSSQGLLLNNTQSSTQTTVTDGARIVSIGSLHITSGEFANSGSVYAANSLDTSASSLSNSGTLYATGNQTLAVSNAITSSGTIAAGQDLSVTAASIAGTSTNVLAAGMAVDGKLTGTGTLSATATGALQTAGQALATGDVLLNASNLNLSNSATGSTAGNLSLTAFSGNVLTQSAKVSTPGLLSITANTLAGQTLDNTAGQISAAQLYIYAGQIDNTQGVIQQTGAGIQTAHIQAVDGIDNSAGQIIANAQDFTLNAGGVLSNTEGLVGHAGTGQLALSVGSLSNTRGQIVGNGEASLSSVGSLTNADGLISMLKNLVVISTDLSNTASGAVETATGIQSHVGHVTLNVQTLANTGSIYAAKELSTTASSLSNSGTMYAADSQTLTVNGVFGSSGTIAAGQNLSVFADSLAGTPFSVLAAGMAADGRLTGTGDLSVTTTGALQSAGQILATGNINLTGAHLDLSGADTNGNTLASTVASTAANVTLKATSGNVLAKNAQIGAADRLSITADTIANQKLDNTSGQLNGKQLQIMVGQLDNTQGVIEQTGSSVQIANIQTTGEINNSNGRIVANAQDFTINAGGALGNTDGLIGHAGTQQLTLSLSSFDNTQGQVLGNGAATLTSAGKLTNADGLISSSGALAISSADLVNTASGAIQTATGIQSQADNLTLSAQALSNTGSIVAAKNLSTTASSVSNSGTLYAAGVQTLFVSGAATNSGTIAAAQDLSVNAASLAGTSTHLLAAGMAADGKLSGTGALTMVTSGTLQSAGQTLATGNVSLTGASLDLTGSTAGSTTADVTLIGITGDIRTTNAQVSSPGLLTITANATSDQILDNASGQLSGKQLQIKVGQLNNTQGEILQTGTGAQMANIQSTGTLNNTLGAIIANAQGFTFNVGGALNNTDGQIGHAGTGTFALNTAATDNTRGTVLGNGALAFIATGDVNNSSGLVAAKSLGVSAAGWNNAHGKLVSTQGDITLHTTTNAVTNTSGLIQSAYDLSLTVEGAGNALQNTQGTIIAARDARLATGQLTNDSGLIAAVHNLSIDAGAQKLSNLGSRSTSASNPLGLIAGNQLDITSGAFDNRAGLISAQSTLNITSSDAVNNSAKSNQASQIYSGGSLNLQAASVDNTGSQILAVGNAALTTDGGLTNTSGLVRVGQTLTLQAGSVDNTNTRAFNSDGTSQAMGLEGDYIAITTATLNNTQGAIRAAQNLSVFSDGQLTNDQGELSSGQNLLLTTSPTSTTSLRVSNQAGQIVADQSVSVSAASLSGAGTIAANGDISLSLQGNHTLAGTLQAGGNLQLQTTGQLTNPISVQAHQSLYITAAQLDNQATGELLSGQTTHLDIAGILTNRGLIDGADTRIQASTVNNVGTGRIYGNRVSVIANTLANQEETASGTTTAATIAGRERVDIGVQNLTNRESALIYSGGDMAIGAALNTNWQASGTALTVNNNSATIESAQSLNIQSASIRNTNEHFASEIRQTSQSAITEYQHAPGDVYSASDNSTRFAAADVSITDCQAQCMNSSAGTSDAFVRYDITRTVNETVVTQNAPGKILAGGGITLVANNLLNDKSQIVAGRTLSVQAGSLDNVQGVGTRSTTDTGTATSYWRVRNKGTDTYGASASSYAPATVEQTTSLNAARYEQNTANAVTGSAPAVSSLSTVQVQASGTGHISTNPNTTSLITVAGTQADAAIANTTNNQTQTQVQTSADATAQAQGAALPLQTGSQVQTGLASAAQAQPTTFNSAASATSGSTETAIRTSQPNTQLPGTSLYKSHPETQAQYLVETDPQFTQYKTWLGSDYMLSALSLNPADTQKRMGDGFYEQKLVRDQVLALTGQRFLDNYTSDEQQYMALMSAGLTSAKALNLRPGIALSAEQVAQLTSDMVWLVSKEVTLADGSKQSVLVPQVYARIKPGDMDGTGALLAGKDVNLKLTGDAINSGTVAGRNMVQINASNIRNLGGTLSADTLALQATQDINNIGGQIQAQSAALLSAGRDINLTTTTQSSDNKVGVNSFAQTGIDRVAGLNVTGPGGVLIASAGRDLNLTAAQVSNQGAGPTSLSAVGNINLSTVTTSASQDINWSGVNYLRQSASQDVGSQINTAGNLSLSAGQDITAKAASVNAEGVLNASAGNNIAITAGQASQSLDTANRVTSKGLLSSRTLSTRATSQSTSAVASNLEANTVSLSAGQDLSVKGSNVLADESVSLNAGRNVKIEAAQTTQSQSNYRQETKSGFMSGGGIGFTVGKREQSQDQQGQNTSAAPSTIGAINGNVSIQAGQSYTQTGSDILTPNGNIDISAKAVTITEARETGSQSTERKFKQSGLTVAVTSPVISALQTANSQLQAAGNTQSSRMQLLAGANAAMNLKQGVDAIKAGQGDESGMVKGADDKMVEANASDKAGGIGISLSMGSSSSQSKSQSSADTAWGSTLTAGGNIAIQATGQGQGSNLTVQGSDIKAGQSTLLKADNQVKLLAAQNTTSESSTNQSKSASVGVAMQLGNGGGGMGLTASASKATGQGAGNSITYTNTQVAGSAVNIESGGDTTLKGAVVKGTQVTADVGGNLTIASLQDQSQYKESSKSAGGSVMVGAGFSGSVNLAKSSINSTYQSVGEQSAIRAGDGGFQVEVKGNSTLTGAQITSTQAAIDNNKNSFSTGGTLTTTDLQNTASYEAKSVSIGLGAGALPGKSASAGMSGVGIGSDKGEASSTTTAGVSGVAGNTAARTGDASTSIAPIFDADKVKKEIEAQVAITSEFGNQAGKAITDYANNQRKALQEQAKSASTSQDKEKAEQAIKDVNMQERALNILTGALTGMAGSVITKEALSTAAEKMRDLMIEDSKKFAGVVDSTGKPLFSNQSGESAGSSGSGFKLGGTRADLDLLCGADGSRCSFEKNLDGSIDKSNRVTFLGQENEDKSRQSYADFLKTSEGQKMLSAPFGGLQGGERTLFGQTYEKGSWQDKLIEAFAGPHDLIGGKLSGLYDAQGNATQGRSQITKNAQELWSGAALLPSAPLAASQLLSPEVWKAIGILLKGGQ